MIFGLNEQFFKPTILFFLDCFCFPEINNFEMNINVGKSIIRTVDDIKCTTGLIKVK